MSRPDDRELTRRVAWGSEEAMAEIHGRYADAVLSIAESSAGLPATSAS